MRPAVPAIALAILVAVLLVVAAWLAAGSGERAPGPVDFPDEARGVVDSSAGPAPEAADARISLTVDVEPKAVLLPPLQALEPPCRLVTADGRDAGVPARVVAGARAAVPDARVGGRHLVAFGPLGAASSCRVVELDPDGVVDVLATWREPVRGRVLTEEGEPVAGAWVWAGQLAADGAPVAVTTGDEGRFDVPEVLGGPGVPLVVRAAGFASRYRLLDLTRPARDPVELRLEPSAAGLDVVLGAAVPEPERGHVALVPAAGDVALLHYPFFLAGMLGSDALAADGTATFDDLPAGSAVEVRIVHPVLIDARPRTVRLRRVRERAVVQGAAAPVLEGTVRDASGAPISGARVRAWADASAADPRPAHVGLLLARAAHAPSGTEIVSSADGRFLVGRPGAGGACRIAVRVAGRPGLLQQVAAGQGALRHDFELPDPVGFAPPAIVRVHLRGEGRSLRARRAGSTFVRWRDLEPFEVRLAEPALVDVRIVVATDGGEAHERSYRGLPVAGVVDLRLDL